MLHTFYGSTESGAFPAPPLPFPDRGWWQLDPLSHNVARVPTTATGLRLIRNLVTTVDSHYFADGV